MKSFTILLLLPIAATVAYDCFQCEDRCITYSWRCDGEVDCPLHGEDERDCEYICPYQTHHRCSDTGLCMDNYHLCDGHYDCANGEDESHCYRDAFAGKRGAKTFLTNGETKSLESRHGEIHMYGSLGIKQNETTADNEVSQ